MVNLIWFHGASVGEIMSIIPIIKKYEKIKKLIKF
jgi:3-deoxy-D-manno-octulosonic-acid transferase